MEELANTGRVLVRPDVLAAILADFAGGFAADAQIAAYIAAVWKTNGVLLDPLTAVGVHVMQTYRENTGDPTQYVLLDTECP